MKNKIKLTNEKGGDLWYVNQGILYGQSNHRKFDKIELYYLAYAMVYMICMRMMEQAKK
jgi:hypothetical protein